MTTESRQPAGDGTLAPLQRRLWFLEQLGDTTAFATTTSVRLRGLLDRRALVEAVHDVVRRHPRLQVRCVGRAGVPDLTTTAAEDLPWLHVEAAGIEAAAQLARKLTTALRDRFSFAAGLVALAPDDHVLVLVAHQAATDGTGLAGLCAEIGARYAGTPERLAKAAPVPPPPGTDWIARLRSTPAAETPADLRRPATWRSAVSSVPVPLPDRELSVPAALAATHTVLARHCGRWDGVVGVHEDGRTVPVPLPFTRALSFRDAVAEAAAQYRGASGADADALAEELAPGADLSRNPWFGVVLEVVDEAPADFGALDALPLRTADTATRYDLVFRLRREAGSTTAELVYATSLISDPAAHRLADHLGAVLADAAARPDAPLGGLVLLSDAERDEVLPAPHDTATRPPAGTMAELVDLQARRSPDAIAVEHEDVELTYTELLARADAVAGRLRELGVVPGELVAVALPRGTDLVATLLGVHRAGAAYVPLDPEHPAERLGYVINDSGSRFLVTSRTVRKGLPATGATVVEIEHLSDMDFPTGMAPRFATPGDPAYAIYTSGSTGLPKGVLIPHRALTNFLWSMRERPGLEPGAVLPAVTTVSFDIAALELFLPLIVGGRVLVAGKEAARDPELLASVLESREARVLQATPVTWRLLLDSGWRPPAGFTALCGGERMPPELAERLCAAGLRLWDLYGPTETTVWSSVTELSDGVPHAFAAVANTTLYVLDEGMAPVPLDGVGELYIGGDGVALGYLGRSRLTAERFVPDPQRGYGARLYRTGDVARRRANGVVEILGRTDDQVKIRGFRVEPGEIETVLTASPDVATAVVHPVGEQLVAYLLMAGNAQPDDAALRALCLRSLPPYMVPAQFVVVREFPTTPNGKIDRKALPAPSAPEPAPRTGRAPITLAEHVVARVLGEVLGRRILGADDDFFALGGHSLLAIQAINRLRGEFGVNLSISALFETRTVAGLTARLTTAASSLPPVRPVARSGAAPLSYAQQRMWFIQQLDPTATTYLEPLAVRLTGPLDPARLDEALTRLFERHEILRTAYPADADGVPVQVIEPPRRQTLVLEHAAPGDILAEELAEPFDLAAAPPVRVRLTRLADDDHVVLFVLHHIATDDHTNTVLAKELTAAYRGEALPEPPVRYTDYAVWQRERMTGDFLEEELAYWRHRLAGLEATELPTDHPRGVVRDTDGAAVRFTVGADVVNELRRIGRAHEATPFITLISGFFGLLRRYTGNTDLAVGIPVSGRGQPEIEDVAGLFVNTIVLRARFPEQASFTELLAAVRDSAITAYPHSDVPFDLVVEDVAPDRDLSRNPLFGTLFTMHPAADDVGFDLPGPAGAKFDIGCHVTERHDGGLDGRIDYATALFEEDTARRFAGHFVRLLTEVARNPEVPVERITFDDGDAHRDFAQGPAAPETRTVPEMIAARARDTNGVAVRSGGTETTFRALDRAANRLAHRLRELGAGPGRFVLVRLPHDTGLVVALLAVLKSGAAYIPLDFTHPLERLDIALKDIADAIVIAPAGTLPEPPAGVTVLTPDDAAERVRIENLPGTAPEAGISADDLAYAVYTSGSTGRPKAAMVTHGGLANYTRWAVGELRPAGGSPLHTSLAYDLALTALYPVLAAGATVDMVDGTEAGADALAEAMTRRNGPYGLVKLTPTHLNLLAGTLPASAFRATRSLVVAGEELRGEQLSRWAEHAPKTRVVNSYGPSEISVACCAFSAEAGDLEPGPVPIGGPLPGTTAYLLDDALREVPLGVVGEIHVGGRGVGRGYLGEPGLTADRFVPDPFSAEPGARMYRTGDLARRTREGVLVFVGRRDSQVKIRGFRVEPGEVESALTAHSAIRAAAVVVDRTDPGNPRLAAHLVADPGEHATVAELRTHLAERLPAHMVPTLWGTLPELPLLGNGKVDRLALPRLRPDTGGGQGGAEPRTPAEREIADVWGELLDVERVSRDARFFDLGGQSLLATRMAVRLRERFGVPMSVRDVFAAQTVGALARLAGERSLALVNDRFGFHEPKSAAEEERLVTGPAIRPVPRTGALPLSFAQQRLWSLEQMSPGGVEYLVATVLRLHGPIRPRELAAAFDRVIARHEVLRTRYVAAPGSAPVQVVDPAPERIILTPQDGDPHDVVAAELGVPIDLATGPVLRVRLVRTGTDEHTLVLVLHHIAIDAWSMDNLGAELRAAYLGSDTPPPPVQYADFAVWQRERLTGPLLRELVDYWRARLDGLEPTELPADRPRAAVRDPRGAVHRFRVPAEQAGAVEELARTTGGTPFTVFLSAFFALLARYSGRTDLAVGVPVSGRDEAALEELIGFFSNTVVLRADLTGRTTFTELVKQVQDTAIEAYAHAELPFDRLVEELAPERDLSRNPLFQVLFAYREDTTGRFDLPGVRVETVPVPSRTAKFDLTLELTRTADGALDGELEYATALFDPDTVERLAAHYVKLLREAVGSPDTAVEGLPLVEAAEIRALTGDAGVRPFGGGVGELIARQALETPDAAAVSEGTAGLSYRELDDAANRFAHHLRAVGVRPGHVVGVCLPRRADLVVALLGVLRAGAAYLPLDPAHPAERLKRLVDDASVQVVVADDDRLRSTEVTIVPPSPPEIAGLPADVAPSVTDPEAVAYVLYTSGSTGRPKGVAIPHRGLANVVLAMIEQYRFGPEDRVLQKTSVSFDASVWEFFVPLVSGGTLVLAAPGAERDPAVLVAELAERGITTIQGVPSLFRLLAEEPGLRRCTSLRRVFSGGEPLGRELVAALRSALPRADVVNLYGPTECSINATTWTAGDDDATTVPIGEPVAGMRATVRSAGGELNPAGVPGELYLGGEGLARGYLGDPRLTAERFVPDPYGPPGARAYRTGDRARRRADGPLEFLGRDDHQVKVRGVRIELGEVEHAIGGHEKVAAVVVVPRVGPEGSRELAAYLVPRGTAPDHESLRAYLLARLPEPYLPSVFVTLDRLPLTTSGKVDRAALPEPSRSVRTTAAATPRKPEEQLVAAAMAELLDLPDVGVDDDFFALGGHSLLAIRLASRIRAVGAEIAVRDVFDARTPARLAAKISHSSRSDRLAPAGPAIVRSEQDGPAPLSSTQLRLWLLERLDPEAARYQMSLVLRLRGELDVDALETALAALRERHEILRTRYPAGEDGTPEQVVEPNGPVHVPVMKLDEEAGLARFVRTLVTEPFTLTDRAPFAPHLIRLDEQDHVFVLVTHHIAGDGWSEEILIKELSLLYREARGGTAAGLEPPALQYADYARWQRAYLTEDVIERELAHWREELSGLEPLELPADRPRDRGRDFAASAVRVTLPASVAGPLTAQGREQDATPFMTLFAVFLATLRRYTGGEDLAVGTVIADRARPELRDLVGPLLNTVIVRVDLSDDPSPATLFARVRDVVLDSVEHAHLPFDRVVEELAPQREHGRSPLVDVSFGLRETPLATPRLDGLVTERPPSGYNAAKFDLTLLLTADGDGGYEMEFEYAEALFSREMIQRFAGHFAELAGSMAVRPALRLSGQTMVGRAERRVLLHEWSRTPGTTTLDQECVPSAFAEQTARTPHAIAVVSDAGNLTYTELSGRARALSQRLLMAGVYPEAPVAVLMERSPSAIVALLAVLQAGGIYVPLDPDQPAERLNLMLDDLSPAAIVTERRFLDRVRELDAPVVAVDIVADVPPMDLPPEDPDRLAYMIYTSGSTGSPKAAMVGHGAFAHHCRVASEVFGTGPADRVLFFAPLTFDPSVEQMIAPLLVGGTVVVSEPGITAPAAFADRIAEYGVTQVAIAPAYYREVVGTLQPHDPRLASLRLMIVAGDVVTRDDARRWLAIGAAAEFVCLYGHTETTIFGTTYRATAAEVSDGPGETALPIGRPIPHTRVYVLDEAMNPVPVGVTGEVYFGGDRLGRGYRHRASLTASRFVPDPFGDEPGARLYRSGDRARYRKDGLIEFLGRVDNQVKIRGFRVELGEIEAALTRHPEVHEAAAAVHRLQTGERRLVGYVVPLGAAPSIAALRDHLRERLPEHMVPATFVTLPALPKFTSQKINRKALPVPGPDEFGEDEFVAPRDEIEEAIAQEWAEVLGLPRVSVLGTFFDLGGHSLLATRLMTRLQRRFGLEIPLRTLFEATTVAAQATALEELAEAEAAPEESPLPEESDHEH